VVQRTKAFQTKLDTQRGFLLGFSHNHAKFTAYIFNPGSTDLSAVLEVGGVFERHAFDDHSMLWC